MSRGHGAVQRRLLDRLATVPEPGWGACHHWARSWYLAAWVYDTNCPTQAQLRAVRRSLDRLTAEGAVKRLNREGAGYGYELQS